MSSKLRTALIVVICIMVVLVLMHLSLNYFVPYIKNMHSGMY